jgi:hypothetical protein
MAHHPGRAQVQEGRAARTPAVLDRGLHLAIAGRDVQAVGIEVVQALAVAEIVRDPAVRRLHRDADAVVLAHVQHRRGQLLVGGPGRGVERGLGGGMVAGGVAEAADGNGVAGDRQHVADAPCLLDRHCGAQRLGQVRCDGRGLRQHPEWLAAPDLVPASGDRIFLAGGEAQRGIHDRVHRLAIGAGQLAEALGHEGAAAVVQEGRIGMAGEARDHRVAFVAGGTDGVEHLLLHAQHARHQVEVARDHLRLQQLQEILRRQRAARQHRFVRLRLVPRTALPVAQIY